ncbi:LCP family protein [Candidatus Saccharibacteria bacterium]|nr:LCP family protein [Candidatus Saccharibacteria bacterium]
MKNKIWQIVNTLASVLQLVVGIWVGVSLAKMGILETKWMVLYAVTIAAVVMLNIVAVFRKSSWLKIFGLIFAVATITGCLFAYRYTNAFNNFLDRVAEPEEATEIVEITREPFAVYISGSDSRTGIETTARSDVNIVVVVNPEREKILLVSIPRDTYVQLHDTTGLKDKLTHAGVYGVEMSKATIEDFLRIQIDDTIKVSFDTVIRVVDQLDGIDIESDQAMSLKAENGKLCEYVVGKQHVDGDCALRFARERKSYETGDRHRGENQQQVIASIIGKLSSSRDYVMKLPEILDIAADSFETSFSRNEISDFIRMQLVNGPKWSVESIAVDGTGTYEPTYSMGANRPLYVMIPSEASVDNVVKKIQQYLESDESENAED